MPKIKFTIVIEFWYKLWQFFAIKISKLMSNSFNIIYYINTKKNMHKIVNKNVQNNTIA